MLLGCEDQLIANVRCGGLCALLLQLVFRRFNPDTYRDDEFSNSAHPNGDLFVTETMVKFDANSFVRLAIVVRTGD